MSEHLPECRSHITGAVYPNRDDVPWDEIGDTKHCWLCDILRACEKRVLGAAREAVAEIYRYSAYKAMDGEPGWVYQGDPLAAIDALREPSGR